MSRGYHYELLRKWGLPKSADAVRLNSEACLSFITFPRDETELSLGNSKLGGHPDLLPEIEWPVWNGKPLAFLAQLCMDELRVRDDLLPIEGWLYFFDDPNQHTNGLDPRDKGSWRVIFSGRSQNPPWKSPREHLVRREIPPDVPEFSRYIACELHLVPRLSPEWLWAQRIREEMEETQNTAGEEILRELFPVPRHQILGHPMMEPGAANEVRRSCELLSRGYALSKPLDKEMYESIWGKEARVWRPLLQLDADARPGMVWRDRTRLSFWIPEDDLVLGNFDNVWMIADQR